MTKSEALQIVAQAWCTEKNAKTEMDVDLAEAFAEILIAVTESIRVELEAERSKYADLLKEDVDNLRWMASECRKRAGYLERKLVQHNQKEG